MPLIESGRGHTKTARLWGYLGAGARQNEAGEWVEHAPAVVFEFTESRESKHPVKFLKDYQGYLKDVLQRLPSHLVNRLAELLPFNWKPVTS